MSTKETAAHNDCDATIPNHARKAGVDGHGATHFYDYLDNVVYVRDADGIAVHDLDATPCDRIGDWVRHVTNKRGDWRDLRYYDGNAFEAMLDDLAAAVVDDA